MASGFSRRFGKNKLLEEVDGLSLIEHTFRALPATLFDRGIIVSQYPALLQLGEVQGYLALENHNAAEGTAAGVRLGVAAMQDMDGVLFAVCDQPWLQRNSVERLIAAFSTEPNKIFALSWQGQRGNPVLFPKHLFPDLAALHGDVGGGEVIKRQIQRLRLVSAHDPKELLDVDEPQDLAQLKSLF